MATHIKELILEFLKQKQGKVLQQESIGKIVNRFLAEETKQHIYLKAATEDSIILHSDSSGATYNLTLIKDKLLGEIQKQFPEIKKIAVHTGAR
ncbi:MAG: hypothetical protein K9L86_04925 [Candidatus Omnitrophica bacterium]|nr:hypothetical protein [Candidatus Omnitrophota bacterium]